MFHYFAFLVLCVAGFLLIVLLPRSPPVPVVCPKRANEALINQERKNTDTFYVDAYHGNDSWNGKYPESRKGDGPFKTLEKAFKQIRKLRTPAKPATLFLRAGTYFMRRKIQLGAEDSNLAVIAYPKDKGVRPLISGGKTITGDKFVFHSYKKNHKIYVAPFYGKCTSHAFLGDKRLIRARKPNIVKWTGEDLTGSGPYLRMKNLLRSTPVCNLAGDGGYTQHNCPVINKKGFKFRRGDIRPNWPKLTHGEILIFNSWTAERRKIARVNVTEGSVYFQRDLRFPIGKHPGASGFRYVVENIFPELDTTGEFYCDSVRKKFYLIPPSGALATNDVHVAHTSVFFKAVGVKNITFQDLAFKHSHDSYFSGYNGRPGMLILEYCDGIRIESCEFSHAGYTGVFTNMVKNMNVTQSVFKDIGNLALTVEYNGEAKDRFAPRNIDIKRNTFKGCGVYAMLQPSCVHVKGVGNIMVQENDISITPYAGLRVGWQKTFTKDYNNGKKVFKIVRNHIHHYGNGILSDFAAIYMSSNMQDCGIIQNMSICHLHVLVSDNAIHHSRAYHYGAIGVFSDTAASSVTVTRNWIYKLADCAVNFHCGQNNIAVNNMIYHISPKRVFGVCNPSVGDDGRMPRQSMNFSRNVIYVNNSNARLYGRGDKWYDEIPVVQLNNYFFKGFSTKKFNGFFSKTIKSWSKWRNEAKRDAGSIIADPKFVNTDLDDYRLSNQSPARGMIESIDLRTVITNSGTC
nr:uncharacterized protein LOC100183085 [Ciona intestinalis]|eukprot:XP_018672533.1 uncharacterized protein LOC100183085 [Ciona intestinalis]